MNQQDIRELQAVREYPSVSILLPIYRKSPDELAQNPIRVKNLVRQTIDRLLGEFSKRDIQPLLQQIDNLTERIDFSSPKDGLALFVNKDTARMFHLPYAPPESVLIDETFATRYLVHARNRTKRYRTLVLSQESARIYECERDSFHEIENEHFPMRADDPRVENVWTSSFGVDPGKYDNKQDQLFFQHVDNALNSVLGEDALPLAVVSVERNLSHFQNSSKHKDQVLATIAGNYEKQPLHEMAERVWAEVRKGFEARRDQVLDQLGDAIGAEKSAVGIDKVWKNAHEGRVARLLVDEHFRYPARVDESGQKLIPAEDATAPDVLDDAVDEIVEQVVATGGDVVFVNNGSLDEYGKIAAILRY